MAIGWKQINTVGDLDIGANKLSFGTGELAQNYLSLVTGGMRFAFGTFTAGVGGFCAAVKGKTTAYPPALYSDLAEAANRIMAATIIFTTAASFAQAATIRLHAFYQKTSGGETEVAAVYGDGHITTTKYFEAAEIHESNVVAMEMFT
jgi:hypothetical protein